MNVPGYLAKGNRTQTKDKIEPLTSISARSVIVSQMSLAWNCNSFSELGCSTYASLTSFLYSSFIICARVYHSEYTTLKRSIFQSLLTPRAPSSSQNSKPTQSRKKILIVITRSSLAIKSHSFFFSCAFFFLVVIIACSRLQESNKCAKAVKTDAKNVIMSFLSSMTYSFRYSPGYGYKRGNL